MTLFVLFAAVAALGFTVAHMFGGSADDAAVQAQAPATTGGAEDAQRRDRLAALDAEIESRKKALADLQHRIDANSAMLEAPYESALVSADARAAPRGGSAPSGPGQAARPQEAELSPRDTALEDLPSDNLRGRPRPVSVAPQKAAVRSAAPAPRISADPPAASPPTGAVRVFIHVPIGAPAALARARAIAADLARDGMAVADIRSVPHAVRRDAVRFFYDADRAALGAVERAVRDASPPGGQPPAAQDFRGYGAPPRPGTLEIWLS
jgi:hypothetical protein